IKVAKLLLKLVNKIGVGFLSVSRSTHKVQLHPLRLCKTECVISFCIGKFLSANDSNSRHLRFLARSSHGCNMIGIRPAKGQECIMILSMGFVEVIKKFAVFIP